MRGFISKIALALLVVGVLFSTTAPYNEINITSNQFQGYNLRIWSNTIETLADSGYGGGKWIIFNSMCATGGDIYSCFYLDSYNQERVKQSLKLDIDPSDYFVFKFSGNYFNSIVGEAFTSSDKMVVSNGVSTLNGTLGYVSTYPVTNCSVYDFNPPDIYWVSPIYVPATNFSLLEVNYSTSAYGEIFRMYETVFSTPVNFPPGSGNGKPPGVFIAINQTTKTLSNQTLPLSETQYEVINYLLNYSRKIYEVNTSTNIMYAPYITNFTYCYLGYCNYFKGALSWEETPSKYNITSWVSYIRILPGSNRNVYCGFTLPIQNRGKIGEVSTPENILEYEDPRFISNYSDYEATFGKSFNTLAYVLTDAYSAGFPNYGITVEVQNENGINRYLITSGLEAQEGFYTDFNLRHYLDCNIYDGRTDDVIPLFFSLDGGYVWVDVATACTQKAQNEVSGGATYNESNVSAVIQGIMCGDNQLIKIDNYTIQAQINSNNSITFWWKYLNGSTGQIATTGQVNYTVGDALNPVVQGKLFCDNKLINVLSTTASSDFIRSDKGVVFVLMFIVFGGLLFLTRSITLNVAVTTFIILAFWLLNFIKLDVAFIMGMLIVGLAIIALIKWGEEG